MSLIRVALCKKPTANVIETIHYSGNASVPKRKTPKAIKQAHNDPAKNAHTKATMSSENKIAITDLQIIFYL